MCVYKDWSRGDNVDFSRFFCCGTLKTFYVEDLKPWIVLFYLCNSELFCVFVNTGCLYCLAKI